MADDWSLATSRTSPENGNGRSEDRPSDTRVDPARVR
jgi:hypothetical protein